MPSLAHQQKEITIPTFSEKSYQCARQKAFDCYNDGIFSMMVSARRYDSPDAFIEGASLKDPILRARAQCKGIILDPLIGEQDFFENTIDTFQKIFFHISLPCFLSNYKGFSQRITVIACAAGDYKTLRDLCWGENRFFVPPTSDLLCCGPSLPAGFVDNKDLVVALGSNAEPFSDSLADQIFVHYVNAIIVFPPSKV